MTHALTSAASSSKRYHNCCRGQEHQYSTSCATSEGARQLQQRQRSITNDTRNCRATSAVDFAKKCGRGASIKARPTNVRASRSGKERNAFQHCDRQQGAATTISVGSSATCVAIAAGIKIEPVQKKERRPPFVSGAVAAGRGDREE